MYAFRCRHSGLYFPPDYAKEWGRKYGIGMGPNVRSECLDTHFECPEAKAYDGEDMHPVGVCYAELDLVNITEEEYNAKRAVLASEDPDMTIRVRILKAKQHARKVSDATAHLAKVTNE